HSSATGMAAITSSHVSAVLQIAVFNLAAINAASLRGRVAMNGSRPGVAVSLDLAMVAATNSAMNTGVPSTPSTSPSTSTGTSPVTQSSRSEEHTSELQ